MMALVSLLVGTYSLWVVLCGAGLVLGFPLYALYVHSCPEFRSGFRGYDRGVGGNRKR